MKKITILFLFASTVVFAQNPQSFDEQGAQQLNSNSDQEAIITSVNNREPLIDTYSSLVDFDAAVIANCSDPSLTSEDFTSAPAGINTCGPVVSSAGDGCFGAGDLQDGFSVEASNGTDVVSISSGQIGNTDALVGANTFAEFTIVNFSPDVFAVAMEIWNNSENTTEARVYGAGGVLIEALNLNTPSNAQTFVGLIADEPITSIELQGANDSGELFGKLLFGADCTILSVGDNALAQIAVYPNPANEVINIRVPSSLEIVSTTVYDLLGQRIAMQVSNNQMDVSGLSNGMYLMTIETTQGSITKKIIID